MSSRRARSGGDVQREHREPMEQVGAKPAGGDLALEIAVGRGDDADVHAVCAVRAHALNLAVLEHPEQLGLNLERQLANLVEKQGSAVGHLELAGPIPHGAGKGTRHVAEQLALRNRERQGRAVDVNQRLVRARRGGVDVMRHEFLADAGFAGNEHREVGGRDQGDLAPQPGHRRAGADERAAARLGGTALQFARHLPAMIRALFERLDEAGRPQGSAGKRSKRRQHARVQAVELVWLERVCRERAHHLAALGQGAPQARVHLVERTRRRFDDPIEGIGQRTVHREPHRLA
jgi:hypothetical protein